MQELLEFSLAHQAQLTADGDLFGSEEDDCAGVEAADALPAPRSPALLGLAVPAGDVTLPVRPSLG